MPNRLATALRQSLALRVVVIAITFFTISAGAVGTVIFNQIRDQIIDDRIENSINEATTTIAAAEFRFSIIQGTDTQVLEQTFTDVLQLGNTPGALLFGREIALVKSPVNEISTLDFTRTSNFLELTSIPSQLRADLVDSTEVKWQLTEITYLSGRSLPGVAIGRNILVQGAGPYEMYVFFSFKGQQDSIDIVARGLLIAGILVFLLILGIAALIVRRVVDPIRRIALTAESFTSGDFTKRVDVQGEDEIAALGRSFNEMAFSIQQQISRLENLSRMQQRFVSDVSHELRNPLTTVRIASEVILAAKDSFDPTVARSAEILMTQITRFDQLLTDLLEVSRFDAAVATLASEPIDLAALLREVIDEFDLRSTRVELRLVPASASTVIAGDARRVKRIMRNLLSNALDHGEGKEVLVTIERRESSVDIGFRDFGVGLDPDQFERVFERFWRADPSRSRERGGTGLGLAIAREDAKLHGGSIRVFGEKGRGALFLLTLPIASGQPISDSPTDIDAQFDSLG
jgi:two-component system sensor histidine kinase MtrB